MKILIAPPDKIKPEYFKQIVELVISGGEVIEDGLEDRIRNSENIGMLMDSNKVVVISAIKRPSVNYRNQVFKNANVPDLAHMFDKELGYIVTATECRGKGYCKMLLSEFSPIIKKRNIYATTRKPEMAHLLEKLGFQLAGDVFKDGLNLFIYQVDENNIQK